MAIKRVNHVAVVVADLDDALQVYRDALGMELAQVETIVEQDVKVGFLPSGGTELELLQPLHAESGIGQFLARRGEGMHHICLEVDDLDATLADLKAKGTRLIDETPKEGAHGKVAFIHPKGAHGVLIELLEVARREEGPV